MVNSSKTKDMSLATCLRNIWLLTAVFDIELEVAHTPGAKNEVADLLSRLHVDNNINQELLGKLQQEFIWGYVPPQYFDLIFFSVSVGASGISSVLLSAVWRRTDSAYRPSTVSAHRLHFRTFLSYLIFAGLPFQSWRWRICYSAQQNFSPKEIRNYMSSVVTMAKFYHLQHVDTSHVMLLRFFRSLSINSTFAPTPRDIFDISTLYKISLACDILDDPVIFKAIFLTAFYGFLCMSNIAPHRAKDLDDHRHFLRKDLTFTDDGALLLIKWTKTLLCRIISLTIFSCFLRSKIFSCALLRL